MVVYCRSVFRRRRRTRKTCMELTRNFVLQVSELDPDTVGLGILVLVIGLVVRIIISYLAVWWGDLTLKERIFVALAWLPKATVQAALGPVALDTLYSSSLDHDDDLFKARRELGLKVLTIAVLVILITAPIGSIAITLAGPRLLTKDDKKEDTSPEEAIDQA